MKQIIEKMKSKYSLVDVGLFVLILLQFVFVFCTNLFKIPATLDNDAAKSMIHTIEVWNQKAIFLPNWSAMTGLEVGDPTMLAAPFYGFVHNIFTAYAFANIIILALYFYVFSLILKKLGVGIRGTLISLSLLIIPYSFGQLLYYNMMFFSAAPYSIIVLVPLLMIFLLSDDGSKFVRWVVLLCLTGIICFICGISSGIYIFITSLAPTIIAYFWVDVLRKDRIVDGLFCKRNIVCFVTAFANLLGIIIGKLNVASTYASDMNYTIRDNIGNSLIDLFVGWFEIFGAYPYIETKVVSIPGIADVLKLVISIACFIALIFGCRKSIEVLFPQKKRTNEESKSDVIWASVFMIIIVDFAACLVSKTTGSCRYLLPVVVPNFIFVGVWIENIIEKRNFSKNQKIIFDICVVALISLTTVFSDFVVVKGQGWPQQTDMKEQLDVVIKKVNEYPNKYVIFFNDTGSAENARVLDYYSDKVYVSYMLDTDEWNTEGINVHDYYMDITDASEMSQDNILIINSSLGDFADIPEYARKHYTKVDEYKLYSIYTSDVNVFDGVSGYSYNDNAIDYCYTDGYGILEGQLDTNGYLSVEGKDDYVIASPLLGESTGTLSISINYSSDESGCIGKVEAWDAYSGELVGSAELFGNDAVATIDGIDLDGRNIAFKIYMNDGKNITIKNFYFTK